LAFFNETSEDRAAPKRIHQFWIELCARVVIQLSKKSVNAQCLAVWSISGHSIRRVRNHDDPGTQRNLVTRHTVRVARPIEVLMMMTHAISYTFW